MIGLVVVIWAIYLSECFVRWRPGDWVLRETASGVRACDAPDVTFFGGRLAFAWTTIFPWSVVHVCRGEEMDAARVRARLEAVADEARWVTLSAAVLFGVLLVGVPVLVVTGRLLPWLYWIAGALVLSWAATLGSFVAAFRRVHGTRPPLETWLVLALSPVDLVRAPSVLSLHVVEAAHPVAAADVLCGDAEFLRVARLWHFDAPGLRQAIEAAAAARDLGDALASPPAALEPGTSRVCPRCSAAYRSTASHCADCGCALTPANPGVRLGSDQGQTGVKPGSNPTSTLV